MSVVRNETTDSFVADDHPLAGLDEQIDSLREVGRIFWRRGWSLGTSSNYSIVVQRDPLQLLVTASGKDKGRLGCSDFVRINDHGDAVQPNQPKSSAESLLHLVAAQQPNVGCILHTHSVWSTELSELYFVDGGIRFEGYEMLKGLAGITTHETSFWLEIFDNTQDIPSLAEQVRRRLSDHEQTCHGYLIRCHGLYTWGRDIDEARRHVEVLEFLLECAARRRMLNSGRS